MAYARFVLLVASLSSVAYAKPIMVSFGTNTGPIIPAQIISSTVAPNAPKTPAPVFEKIQDDLPNPNQYKPLSPHQYRNKIYSYKPHPNLILGTPIDQKYQGGGNPTTTLEKHNYYKRAKLAKALGFEYRGPQFFDKQAYELEREKKKAFEYKARQGQENSVAAQKRSDSQPPIYRRTMMDYQQGGTVQPEALNYQQPIQNGYRYDRFQQRNPQQLVQANNVNNRYQVREYNTDINANVNANVNANANGNVNGNANGNLNANANVNINRQQPQKRYTQTKTVTELQQAPVRHNYQYNSQEGTKYVPQIGIAYSSGLKYYVPQVAYYEDGENAIFTEHDQKFYH